MPIVAAMGKATRSTLAAAIRAPMAAGVTGIM